MKPWDPAILRKADYLRQAALRFRLENYNVCAPRLPAGAEDLRPRSRDIISSLAGPLIVGEYDELLVGFFRWVHDSENRDLLPARQSATLGALFFIIHTMPDIDEIRLQGLADLSNQLLKTAGERFQMSPRKQSAELSCLDAIGLADRSSAAAGNSLPLSQETIRRIHQLWAHYRSPYLENTSELAAGMVQCLHCKERAKEEQQEQDDLGKPFCEPKEDVKQA